MGRDNESLIAKSGSHFSETAWPIKVKFYVERPWIGETKV